MASERMMQAIGTLERAISRLEQAVAQGVGASPTPPPAPPSPIDAKAARAALRSLDDLITELKDKSSG